MSTLTAKISGSGGTGAAKGAPAAQVAPFILPSFPFAVRSVSVVPSPLLKPDQVIAIQLKALNDNDNPYKNFGIEQTWEFAHPQNRKFTGPIENFTKMMFSSSYVKMINHNKHKINLIQISNNIAFYFIEIIDKDGTRLGFNWIVERVLVKGEFYNCWMTVSAVSYTHLRAHETLRYLV